MQNSWLDKETLLGIQFGPELPQVWGPKDGGSGTMGTANCITHLVSGCSCQSGRDHQLQGQAESYSHQEKAHGEHCDPASGPIPSRPGQCALARDWLLSLHMMRVLGKELTLSTDFSRQRLCLTLGFHCATYLAVECRWSVGSRPRPETGGYSWRWNGSCRQIQVG